VRLRGGPHDGQQIILPFPARARSIHRYVYPFAVRGCIPQIRGSVSKSVEMIRGSFPQVRESVYRFVDPLKLVNSRSFVLLEEEKLFTSWMASSWPQAGLKMAQNVTFALRLARDCELRGLVPVHLRSRAK
jgi:hypothetical protein